MKELRWDKFKKEISAFTTTRVNGHSSGPYAKNNFGLYVGDDKDTVIMNRRDLVGLMKITETQIVFAYQSHSTVIAEATKADGGRGFGDYEDGIPADGLYTREPRLALAIVHADCVPVFLYDKKQKLAAVIHAGREGTLKKAAYHMVKKLIDEEKCEPRDLHAFFGPSLTFSNLEISESEKDEILAKDGSLHVGIKKISGKFYLDVPFLNYFQLRELGIPQDNIELSNIDTFEDQKNFYSFRRDKVTGRHASVIMLK